MKPLNTNSVQYKNMQKWVKEITDGELELMVTYMNPNYGSEYSYKLDRTSPRKGQKRRYVNCGTLKRVKERVLKFIETK